MYVCMYVCPESDLRDGSMEFNDLLDSDEELPDTGARLLKFWKFSFLTVLGHFFMKFWVILVKMASSVLNMAVRGLKYNNLV